MEKINRANSSGTTTIASGAALSDVVEYRDFAGGMFKTAAAHNATTKIAFQVSDSLNGTFTPLFSTANALVEVTITLDAAKWYPLPDELFGAHFFKFWCEASGTGVNQTGDKVLAYSLKG